MNELKRLLEITRRLRAPDGCPWDRAQSVASLAPQLREELCEVLGAVNSLDEDNLKEELGDILFGVLMLCRVAEEDLGISLEEVSSGIAAKMQRRHPHVFGKTEVEGVGEVVDNWERIKATEKKLDVSTAIPDTCPHLPALVRAQKIQKKVARLGFDWSCAREVLDKIKEEVAEIEVEIEKGNEERMGEEIADLIFSAVNLARFQGFDAETLLHRMIARWVKRFQALEALAGKRGLDLASASLEEMDDLWDEVSRRGAYAPTAAGEKSTTEVAGKDRA